MGQQYSTLIVIGRICRLHFRTAIRMYIETVQAAVWIGSVAAEKKTIYVRQAAQIAQMWLAVAVSH